MPPSRASALALRGALTFAAAVAVHGVVHAAGDRSFAWDSPAHGLMLLTALALLAVAGSRLGIAAPAAERRRRLALVRAALPRRPLVEAGFALGTQGALAAVLLIAEGAALEPQRLAVALGCGLVALAISALVFAGSTRRVVALLADLSAARERDAAPPVTPRRAASVLRISADFRLFVPNRPPPLAA